jgi:hypothetical protein
MAHDVAVYRHFLKQNSLPSKDAAEGKARKKDLMAKRLFMETADRRCLTKARPMINSAPSAAMDKALNG